jgi:integrase/recombinase XerD
MSGAYPQFKTSYTHEELVEYFLLTPADLQLVLSCRGEANRLQDVDLDHCQIRVEQGKGGKDRSVLFPTSFRGELAQYMRGLQDRRAVYLFESNRLRPYSSRRIRQIVHEYAQAAGIRKRAYPHLFRHQIITFLTKKGIISPKLQLLSGHAEEKNLAIYRDLALADVSAEYEEAMRSFPVR